MKKDGGNKEEARAIKRASVETGCLFEKGLILMGQGDASALVEGAIHKGRGNMEEMQRRVKTASTAAALKTSGIHQDAERKTLDSAESLGSSDCTARILACFISN